MMTSKYWIKLYHEMLDDPKVGRLSDRLFRRMVQCFLLAGEIDQDGLLPPLADMAWRFRIEEDILETELSMLADVGILSMNNGQWFVSKFEERQSAVSSTERSRRWRERNRKGTLVEHGRTKGGRNGDDSSPDTDIDTDKDTDREEEAEAAAAARQIFTTYENEIGLLTPIISEKINAALDDYPNQWITAAIDEAARYNARSWSYIESILKRWKSEGFKSKHKYKKRVKGYIQQPFDAVREELGIE